MLASSAGRSSRSVSVSRAGSIAASRRAKPPEIADLRVDRRPAQILEQVVVKVNAVERRVGRMRLVQPREVLVDEMRQGFGGIHSGRIGAPRMAGILYVVATPIGNLEDVTLRALRILREVSLIAAEDTRRTARLLQHYSISTRTTSLHEHNEREKTPQLARSAAGRRVDRARVGRRDAADFRSGPDAGRRGPRRRDPRREPFRDPAPSWPPSLRLACRPPEFVFLGFPPTRSKDRKRSGSLSAAAEPRLAVFFEAPHRIRRTLGRSRRRSGAERPIGVARELTKVHEELVVWPIMPAFGVFYGAKRGVHGAGSAAGSRPQAERTVSGSRRSIAARTW